MKIVIRMYLLGNGWGNECVGSFYICSDLQLYLFIL